MLRCARSPRAGNVLRPRARTRARQPRRAAVRPVCPLRVGRKHQLRTVVLSTMDANIPSEDSFEPLSHVIDDAVA